MHRRAVRPRIRELSLASRSELPAGRTLCSRVLPLNTANSLRFVFREASNRRISNRRRVGAAGADTGCASRATLLDFGRPATNVTAEPRSSHTTEPLEWRVRRPPGRPCLRSRSGLRMQLANPANALSRLPAVK